MRRIGSLDVSVVGLGTNNFGFRMEASAVPPVVDAALEAGVNFFDTADSYRDSEEKLAAALGRRRDDVIVATKFGTEGGASPAHIRDAVERSLRRLRTDRIDLYQLHRPDPETPIAHTLGALEDLKRVGTVREIGCSNFSAEQLREAPGFVSVQNHYSVLHRDDEVDVVPECERLGIAYIPYLPLAHGLLSGKYRRGEPPPAGTRIAGGGERVQHLLEDRYFDVVETLTAWAEARDHTILELAIAWLAAKPVVASVIAGATKPEQVRANAAAATWQMTADEVAEVDALAKVG